MLLCLLIMNVKAYIRRCGRARNSGDTKDSMNVKGKNGMKKTLSIIVLLSICLACTSCKVNENDVVGSLETENSITETISETTTTVATETTTQTSVTTTSETTVETTIEIPRDYLNGLPEFTKEEIYNTLASDLLRLWPAYRDYPETHDCYCRERYEFNTMMQLEIISVSYLVITENWQEYGFYSVLDNCYYKPNYGSSSENISLQYLVDMMKVLFDVEISEAEIAELLSDEEDIYNYTAEYDVNHNCIVRIPMSFIFPYNPNYEITEFDDDSFTCNFYYNDDSIDGERVILQNTCQMTVSIDWNVNYPLGFIITDIDVNDI